MKLPTLYTCFLVLAMPMVAVSQTSVPAVDGTCPNGTRDADNGYCESIDGANFIPAVNHICPMGARYAGAGYCRSDSRKTFVPAINNACPAGSRDAGAGYCRCFL